LLKLTFPLTVLLRPGNLHDEHANQDKLLHKIYSVNNVSPIVRYFYQYIASFMRTREIPAIADDITILQSRLLTPKRSTKIKHSDRNSNTIIIWPTSSPTLKAKSGDNKF
jgi:hypothetical protein